MDILYLLVPLSLVLVSLIGAVFWWALQSGQFDDLEGPAYEILMDEDDLSAPIAGGHGDAAEPAASGVAAEDESDASGEADSGRADPRSDLL